MKKAVLFSFILVPFFVCAQSDTTKHKLHFELSFGSSVLFIPESQVTAIHTNTDIVLPTNSLLFFVEMRPEKKLRVPVFFNLPTESKQFIVNNVIVNERANPTIGSGVEFNIFHVKLDERSKIEFEAGPLVSIILGKHWNIRAAPVLAGRFRISRGENFVMYIGTSYSIGLNAFGLLYGTGTVF